MVKCLYIEDYQKEVLIQFKKKIAILNLEKIQSFIDKKNIKITETYKLRFLKKLKLINKNSTKLKILGSGELKDKINIEADLASKSVRKT